MMMSNNENIDDVGAGAEDGGGTTRRNSICKKDPNGIPHMELMRHIFGRQGSKPEAMYSTHVQDAMYAEQNEIEQLDKHVPETQYNDGDDSNIIHKTDVHHHSQTISLDSPPRSPIGPSKRSNRKKTRVAPYESSREAKERIEKNEAQPFKEAYEILKSIQGYDRHGAFSGERFKALQHCHGDPPSANGEQNITRTTMESHKEFGVPSNSELMSLFEEIGYKRGFGNNGDGGESSETRINLDH
ncbi:hypothetical protein DY000_02012873 [Brassica cretica]|uniref:Uncharacterized protein n=1 Tax=Brassica cretica TaxID=69181 RepID=A0ABQ7CKG5_BRACR|nr:hypothetical protein DY000_02012873 [Brassica cretica]